MAATSLNNLKTSLTKIPDGQIYGVASISAATTLTVADSGRYFKIPSAAAAAYAIALPTPTIPGLKFHFVYAGAAVAGFLISINSPSANTAKGFVMGSNGAGAVSVIAVGGNTQNCNFTATAIAGDYISCWSDGTNWQFLGQSGATAGLSFS